MTIYKLNDIYPTIQGEGCQTGQSISLIRLMGCQVGCHWCDQKETWSTLPGYKVDTIEQAIAVPDSPQFTEVSGTEINAYLREHYPQIPWVLVTGGEPAEQDLEALVYALHDGGYKVALETSGTATGHMKASFDWVCCSPKFNNPGRLPVLPEVVANADEVKVVVGKESHIDEFLQYMSDHDLSIKGQICLQPMSAGKRATELCTEVCLAKGWRLSVQVHKVIQVR